MIVDLFTKYEELDFLKILELSKNFNLESEISPIPPKQMIQLGVKMDSIVDY